MAAEKFVIQGRVQGVAYRYATQEKAVELGLEGWVRNLPDGSVEALAQGEREVLAVFAKWLWEGPAMARVTQVERCSVSESASGKGFQIRR